MPNPITLDHVKAAAEWALTAQEPCPIDGLTRQYAQDTWDCGTSCCMWGAASILAGNGPALAGPPREWANDAQKKLVVALLNSPTTFPRQVLDVIAKADLRGANLRGADLSGANLHEANLSGADLHEANLRGADLIGANLHEANLSEANLSEADLRWANLIGANLIGANLSGANLSEADLSEAVVSIGNITRTIK